MTKSNVSANPLKKINSRVSIIFKFIANIIYVLTFYLVHE